MCLSEARRNLSAERVTWSGRQQGRAGLSSKAQVSTPLAGQCPLVIPIGILAVAALGARRAAGRMRGPRVLLSRGHPALCCGI